MMQPDVCCCHGDLLVRVERVSERTESCRESCRHGDHCYTVDFYMEHYKYGLELYLNGTRTGRHTHTSIRLVTLQGPFDNALTWPPNFRMRLSLVNQYGGDHLDYTLSPDTEGNFTQPQWETFVPLNKLRGPHSIYVKDDVMFIKVTKLKNRIPTTFDSILGVSTPE